MALSNGREPAPIAVVLPGGGARGAYEIGALSILLPVLEARGERVALWCGTSVGAINAAIFASRAQLRAGELASVAEQAWRAMVKGDVVAPIVGPALPVTALRLLGDALGVPKVRLSGLLDPRPLTRSLDRWVDWLGLSRNVRTEVVDAVCVVATSLERGGPVAFVHSAGTIPVSRPQDEIRYVRTPLRGDHLRASSAIPFMFAPVEVRSPHAARGFYSDGATRLNSPIKPALALGAHRVIVIGFEPMSGRPVHEPAAKRPHLADVASNVLDGLLLDPVAEDVHRLVTINEFFVDDLAGPQHAARSYRRARGRPPYRKVAYALVAPERRGELGRLAERAFAERYGGLRALRSPDYALLAQLLRPRTRSRGELLSFLFFDPAYIGALIDAGRSDARRWLARHPGFWCCDGAHDLAIDLPGHASAREEDRVREWRETRRRT